MTEPATPKKDESSIEEKLAAAELRRIEIETSRMAAETTRLNRPWYQHEAFLAPLLPLLAAVIWFLYSVYNEQLSDKRSELLAEISEMQSEKVAIEQKLEELRSREVTYRELANSAETRMRQEGEQHDNRVAKLKADIAELQGERAGLAESVSNQLEREELLAEIYATGGALDVISNGEKNKFRLSFAKSTRVQNVNLTSQFTNAPMFPFAIPNSHGDMNLGDSLVNSVVKNDVSQLVQRSLALLEIDALLLETPDFIIDRETLRVISLSQIRSLTIFGPGCSDEWLSLLENNAHLQSLSLFDTTTSPKGVVHFIDSSPNLSTVEYFGARQDLLALREGRRFDKIRHLHISTAGHLDPQHLAPFQNLDTLAISCPIMPKATWPTGLLSSLKYLVLKDIQGVVPTELSSASRLQVLSLAFQNRQENIETLAIANILANFHQLVELHLDLNYANFNIETLKHNLQLRYLGLSHANISGEFNKVAILRDLRVLRLHGSPVSPEALGTISQLPNLETLDLSNLHGESNLSPLQPMFIQSLSGLQYQRSLRNVLLEGNYISEKAIEELASMTWLRTLSASPPLEKMEQTRALLKPLQEGTIMNLQPGRQQ